MQNRRHIVFMWRHRNVYFHICISVPLSINRGPCVRYTATAQTYQIVSLAVSRMKMKSLIRNGTIITLFFTTFILIAWNYLIYYCRNLYFHEIFTVLTKVYPANYFVIDILKHNTDFSKNFYRYYLLFLLILPSRYTSTDLH